MTFYRTGAKRFIFSNNLPLNELEPSEIIQLDLMHPITSLPNSTVPTCEYAIENGSLIIHNKHSKTAESSIFVGGVNPFATYAVDVESVTTEGMAEIAIELASLNLGDRMMVVSRHGVDKDAILLRIITGGKTVREEILWTGPPVKPPYRLLVQLSGAAAAVFIEKEGKTEYRGHISGKAGGFGEYFDFRNRKLAMQMKFNIATRLPPDATLKLAGAKSFLSAGMGQADIRIVTHKDGKPFFDANRLWFTFSCRGIYISDSVQGVFSLNPTLFDLRFEGMILFDRDDGMLRNDYAMHLLYDDDRQKWFGLACNFSEMSDSEHGKRTGSHLVTAVSEHDPRRGFSVMKSEKLKDIPGEHEDPCLIYDYGIRKWRLLTSEFAQGIHASSFESEQWNEGYKRIAGPVNENSTGTQWQKIGNKFYAFCGSSARQIFIYSYPDLKKLGTLNMDLPPFNANTNGRVWPNIFSLPAGFPVRYMALMMDRVNFPNISGEQWSYGALYRYEAYTEDSSF